MIDKVILREEAEKLGVLLDETALDRFDIYAERLVETNKTLNLTAITDPDGILYKHFIDSLSLLSCVNLQTGAKVIDVGTGAGFPGVVLLIARPDLKITLLDGTNKRLVFIDSVLRELRFDADIVHQRAELAGKDAKFREKYDLVTARAVANLNTLGEYCLPFVRVGGIFAPMKAAKTDEEIVASEEAIKLLGGRIRETKHFNIESCGDRYIIITEKISQTPSKYPRASAQISKKPL